MSKIEDQICEFEKTHPNIKISYGGDGTVLSIVEKLKSRQSIIPFRNYGLCNKHLTRLEDFLSGNTSQTPLKMTRCPFIEFSTNSSLNANIIDKGIAEVVFKQKDMTEALRSMYM